MSAKSIRVLSWKSGSSVSTVSFINHRNENSGVTIEDVCFVNNNPFDILKSHLRFGALGSGFITRPGQLGRELFVCFGFGFETVPLPAPRHLQQLVWSAHEDVNRARHSERGHTKHSIGVVFKLGGHLGGCKRRARCALHVRP